MIKHKGRTTFTSIFGFIIIAVILYSIVMFPINVMRGSYYADKNTILVTFTDKHKASYLVNKNEYKRWLFDRGGLTVVNGTKISEDTIAYINIAYSIWTHDN